MGEIITFDKIENLFKGFWDWKP